VDGKVVMAEYTVFPIFDADHGRGLIAILAHLPVSNVRIAIVQRSVEWEWLELRGAAVN
jgi:muconolactone delta-isomerase